MVKLVRQVSLCLLLSLVILVFQLVTLQYFHISSYSNLNDNVDLFHQVCNQYGLQCVFMDINLLKTFLHLEVEHRVTRRHNHIECRVFCRKDIDHVTFMVSGDHFKTISKDDVLNRFSDHGFSVYIDEREDTRELSLETRHSKKRLLFHVFLLKDTVLLHILISYEILNNKWTNTCDLDLLRHSKGQTYNLENSIYCKQENLYKNFEYTSAVIDNKKFFVPQYMNTFLNNIHSFQYIACNYEQARVFYSAYGYDTTEESVIFRRKAKRILRIAIQILSRLEIPFWLSSGTCLGWFRQCGFIPHSKDVDIGIRIKDYKPELLSMFQAEGFYLKNKFGKVADSFELSFLMEDLKLDLFFFYDELDYMWNGGTQVKSGKKFKYIFEKLTLCWTRLADLIVRVPCNTKNYIMSNYGDSWNVLVKTWDWKSSPPNVRENGEWPPEERIDVIQTFL